MVKRFSPVVHLRPRHMVVRWSTHDLHPKGSSAPKGHMEGNGTSTDRGGGVLPERRGTDTSGGAAYVGRSSAR